MLGQELRERLRSVQWERGGRAAIAIGSAMVVCHVAGAPPGAAALGAFDALLVDNGGPYRTRLVTMATTLAGGAAALVLGSLMPAEIGIATAATAAVCFAIIFARVLSQPLASSGVLILVLYFAGVGGTQHTLAGAIGSAELLLLGGLWAVVLSLVLWPVDPFRPARVGVAECYGALGDFMAGFGSYTETGHPDGGGETAFEWQRQQRLRMERAREALAATAARAPSRTIRARNLTVLLETSDLLLARTVRLTELADVASTLADSIAARERLASVAQWLAGAERAIHEALLERPADAGAAFAYEGSLRVQFIQRRRQELRSVDAPQPDSLLAHVLSEEREALLELEIAFDAVGAIWTGAEVKRIVIAADSDAKPAWDWVLIDSGWRDAIEANWSMQSRILRHALRMSAVGAVDVVVMRLIHINHGFWLPMTSIILLQPYSAGTARKSMQRVTGTIAGGILAALIAAAAPSQAWLTPVITLLAALTVATFAVDYAVYSFFLTPTFVLLSLPHPHDWRYAGVRIGTTLAGATIAILAMRLLWPERAEVELGALFRRGAAADAAYLRAMLRFWEAADRRTAEREILAPARRACGLASNDAEEAVDRVMQEPRFGRLASHQLKLRNEALTFVTYLRRLTQSITTLAAVGRDTPLTHRRVEFAAQRMEQLAAGDAARIVEESPMPGLALVNVAEEQMVRVERQVGVLERAAEGLR
jgi:uncharacterized membrane protein YccC